MDNILFFPGPASAPAPDEADRTSEQNRRTLLAMRDDLLALSANLITLKRVLCELQQKLECEADALKRPTPVGAAEGKP